jgi:glycosyltransferase involved in cell wall biosynthesis
MVDSETLRPPVMPQPLNIAYFLDDTDLSGGVRVQVAQADSLIARGHSVAMFTKGPPLRWRKSRADWRHIDDFSTVDAEAFDFVIGGFWTTVEAAYEIAGKRALHFCQGYEGAFTAYQDIKPQIDAVYRLPIPKLVVSRHLVDVCEQFSSDVTWVGQIVDEEFYRSDGRVDNQPLRVLLAGASQIDFKGIPEGYGAVAHARFYGAKFDLIRVSPWAPGGDEPVEEMVAQFHVALNTDQMARLIQSCDIFLGPSRSDEGFGLPAAEAMASGLPAILTRIQSFLSFSESPDFALFADEGDAAGLGDALVEMTSDAELRQKLSRRGREVVEQFRSEQTGARLEKYLLERRAERPNRS